MAQNTFPVATSNDPVLLNTPSNSILVVYSSEKYNAETLSDRSILNFLSLNLQTVAHSRIDFMHQFNIKALSKC